MPDKRMCVDVFAGNGDCAANYPATCEAKSRNH